MVLTSCQDFSNFRSLHTRKNAKDIIRSCKSKTDIQHNSQWRKCKRYKQGSTKSFRNVYVTNNQGNVPSVLSTVRSFLHSWLIIGIVWRVTSMMLLVEHMSSPQVFSWISVAQYFVFCAVFGRSLFVPLEILTTRQDHGAMQILQIIHDRTVT
jgi:hypothetical protein